MEIILKQINELTPYENNPRKNDKSVNAVANSIKQFGFKVPIIIDGDGVIVAGHTRYKAAVKLKLDTVPCIVADDLTEEQIKAFRIADNKVGETSEWDFDLLNSELDEILNIDMSEFGFDLNFDSNDPVEIVEDEVPEVDEKAEPKAKLGDIYLLGAHRLMCGDSTSADDVARLMDGQKADLLLTDPPYNVALGMGGSVDEARKRHRRTDGLVIMNDKMQSDEFRKFLTSAFQNAKENMKGGAAYYVWHADSEGYNFRGALIDAGFQLRQTLIWVKNSITLGRQDYQWKHEPCLYGWNGGASHIWYSDRKQPTT